VQIHAGVGAGGDVFRALMYIPRAPAVFPCAGQVGGSIIWVDIIPWLCLGWLALGVVLALVLRKRSPEKYEVLGRMVNAGID
jgi:hypothetical protein